MGFTHVLYLNALGYESASQHLRGGDAAPIYVESLIHASLRYGTFGPPSDEPGDHLIGCEELADPDVIEATAAALECLKVKDFDERQSGMYEERWRDGETWIVCNKLGLYRGGLGVWVWRGSDLFGTRELAQANRDRFLAFQYLHGDNFASGYAAAREETIGAAALAALAAMALAVGTGVIASVFGGSKAK